MTGAFLTARRKRPAPTVLLGRPPLAISSPPVGRFVGQTVLVTGAGGFIGAGLCRRLACAGVRHLILLEHTEGGLYRIDQELAMRPTEARITLVLGNVGDSRLLDEVLAVHRPDVIFHAAAFKHVPLLEDQPFAAVRNNVLGTHALAQAASRWGVRQLVLLSTDKAVNPRSVMGASKRIAELMLLAESASGTRCSSLRLGNVLGSYGSVLPRFRAQIRHGQPITITHPEATRYFVTLSEAIGLLLYTALQGEGGDILAPDLDPPVRILDLAHRLKREALSDVPIVFSGLRPGEKLTEQLWREAEVRCPTSVPGLFRLNGPRPGPRDVESWAEDFKEILNWRATASLLAKICEVVPDYQPSEQVLEVAGL